MPPNKDEKQSGQLRIWYDIRQNSPRGAPRQRGLTMTQAVVSATIINEAPEIERLYTFQEYLEYEGEPDIRYELVRGKLLLMPASTHLHTNICRFLLYKFQRYFATGNLDLVVNALATGVRTEENTSRIPDLVVCSQTVWEQVLHRTGAGVLDFAEKPILVVEVVSSNRRDDYLIKRNEYEMAQIAEYWIVDPKDKLVRVFSNSRNKGYDWVDFKEGTSIVSPQFPELVLSVKELLNPSLVEQLMKEEQSKIQTLEQRAEISEQRAETERTRAEISEQRAESERIRAESERIRAEISEQRAETLEQQAESERIRAEKLAQLLREMGINPDAL